MSKLFFEILAVDKVTAELGKVNSQITQFTGKVEKSFGGLTKAVGLFSGAFTAVFAASRVAQMVTAGFQYGDMVRDLANNLGMTTDEAQKWKFVTEKMGVSIESLNTPLAKMNQMVYQDHQALKNLGVATRDSNGAFRDKSAVLEDVLFKLADIPDPTIRAAKSTEIFGRSGYYVNQIVGQGSGALRELIGQTKEYGLVLSEDLIDKLDAAREKQTLLNKQLEVTKAKFTVAISPLISQWLTGASDIVDKLSEWLTAEDETTQHIVTKGQKIATLTSEISLYSKAVKGVADNSKDAFAFENLVYIHDLPVPISQATAKLKEMQKELKELQKTTMAPPGDKEKTKAPTESFAEFRARKTAEAMEKLNEKLVKGDEKRAKDQQKIDFETSLQMIKNREMVDDFLMKNQKNTAMAEIEITQNKYAEMRMLAGITSDQIVAINAAEAEAIKQIKTASALSAVQSSIGALQSVIGQQHKYIVGYKVLAMAEAGINTYIGATKALASSIPPWNIILMGITIAAGLAQQAKIAAMSFASGGFAPPGSFIRTGEQGMEYMHLIPGGGAHVFNSSASTQIDRSDRSSRNMVVNVYDQTGNVITSLNRSLRKGEMDRFIDQFMARAGRKI